jgi:4'-phosphopantetheinyl transferase
MKGDASPLVAIEHGDVHVWSRPLHADDPTLAALRATLCPEELERAARFRFERDARRFAVARAWLRDTLSRYLGCPPRAIELRYSAQGKPFLSATGSTLQFNIAHSDDLAVLGVCLTRSIGIDVERIREDADHEPVIRRFFAADEIAQWLALPVEKRVDAFFHGWTCKEALVKAMGDGLSTPLDGFAVSMSCDEPAMLRHVAGNPDEAARWRLWSWIPQAGYRAAACVEGVPRRILYYPSA